MSASIHFLGNAEKEYEQLIKIVEQQKKKEIKKSIEQQLIKSIKDKSELIKNGIENRKFYGEKIQYKDIPKQLECFGHLWKVKLTGYWRMIYTVDNKNMPEVVAFILEVVDHNKYNKLFKRKDR